MKRSILIWIIGVSGVLLFGLPLESEASPLPIFGPETFTRTTGAPNQFQRHFSNCEAAARFELVVQNGNPDGTGRISSGSIQINGVSLVKPQDLNQQVSKLQVPISVQSDNSLDVSLNSKPGSFISISVVCTSNCLDLQIISPADQAVINQDRTFVKGNVQTSTDEVAVLVNSHPTEENGGSFGAVGISLVQGDNLLTATATNTCGEKAQAKVTVHTQNPALLLLTTTVLPEAGIAPLPVTFRTIATLGSKPTSYAWDFDGEGTVDKTGSDLSEVSHTYPGAGIYFPTLTVSDNLGHTAQETLVVNVLTQAQVDAFFKERWTAMTQALHDKDIDRALTYFTGQTQGNYREGFMLIADQLPGIFATPDRLQFVSYSDKEVRYDNIVQENGKLFSYPVSFIRDIDGLWKIKSF